MSDKHEHRYSVTINWAPGDGPGTIDYRTYSRDHEVSAPGKSAQIAASADPAFRGDSSRWNPEEMLVAAVSSCHQLWYLHLCAVNDVCVTHYEDRAEGLMRQNADGSGEFEWVVLRPRVTIASGSDPDVAAKLHKDAHGFCFIARSVNFDVRHEPDIVVGE